MSNLRLEGINTAIIDKSTQFSEILLGILMRASAHGYKIALVDTSNTATKLIQVLENFSLTKEFKQHFKKIHIETFSQTPKGISRGILPLVEFQTISQERMYQELYKFDIVLIDHPTSRFINNPKTLSFFKDKQEETEIIVSLEAQPDQKFSTLFDQIVEQTISTQQSLISNKTINILSPQPFSELYAYGHLIKEFINKENVKYLAFDKGDLFYGEHLFFSAIKHWKKQHRLYGDFDYVATGLPRHTGPTLRNQSTPADRKEVEEGFMLLQTALKKQTPVVISNIDEALKHEILSEEEFYNNIEKANKEVLIPTDLLFNNLKSIAGKTITFSTVKSPQKPIDLKKGINF